MKNSDPIAPAPKAGAKGGKAKLAKQVGASLQNALRLKLTNARLSPAGCAIVVCPVAGLCCLLHCICHDLHACGGGAMMWADLRDSHCITHHAACGVESTACVLTLQCW